MSFLIRPAIPSDLDPIHRLATSLSAQGFLTLPSEREELKSLIDLSVRSFQDKLRNPDEGQYLFVLEGREGDRKVIGCSLVIARHGTRELPHLFFQISSEKRTIQLRSEISGRTELGGLILDPAYRGRSEKLGRQLSYIRLQFIRRHPDRFQKDLIAELLPPLTPDGKSLFWEALGRKFTGMDYREADLLSRRDKGFVEKMFPREEIPIDSLPKEVQEVIGVPGPGSAPAAKMLEAAGFRFLNQIDPFDGGPHYGARQKEVREVTIDVSSRFDG